MCSGIMSGTGRAPGCDGCGKKEGQTISAHPGIGAGIGDIARLRRDVIADAAHESLPGRVEEHHPIQPVETSV